MANTEPPRSLTYHDVIRLHIPRTRGQGMAWQGRAGKGERENRYVLVNARSTVDQGRRAVTSLVQDDLTPVRYQ